MTKKCSYFCATMIKDHLQDFFKSHQIDYLNKTFLLALSGGIDSTALFYALRDLNCTFEVAHCNFNLRSDESDKDEAFVRQLCQAHSIKAHIKRFETKQFAQDKGLSTQLAARELRYQFFSELMENHCIDFLLTAHHLDDNLETILIQLGKGISITNISGIPDNSNQILRPLLKTSKEQLKNYLTEQNLVWREDQSNKSLQYQRNRIRQQVVPDLIKSDLGYLSGFQTSLLNLKKDQRLFQSLIYEKIESNSVKKEELTKIDLKLFKENPEILHHALKQFGDWDEKSILDCIQHNKVGRVFKSKSHELLIDRKFILVRKEKKKNPEVFSIFESESDLKIANFNFGSLPIHKKDELSKKDIYVDKELLKFPLSLRSWKHGDAFVPFGFKGKKKLSDYFTDLKLNLWEKEDILVLEDQTAIIAIAGRQIDDNFKVTNRTKTIYFVQED